MNWNKALNKIAHIHTVGEKSAQQRTHFLANVNDNNNSSAFSGSEFVKIFSFNTHKSMTKYKNTTLYERKKQEKRARAEINIILV